MRHSRSPFCHFCIALRKARKLTQEELSKLAGVAVSTIKNIELGEPVSVQMLWQVYRKGLRGDRSIAPEEWHQVLGYWLQDQFPEQVKVETLVSALRGAKADKLSAMDRHLAELRPTLERMNAEDVQTLVDFAKACAGKHGGAMFSIARSALALGR